MDVPRKGITLTPREGDILKLIANGLSDSEIAEALVLTVGTVKWYNRQIYNKLGVANRTLALVQAQRLGLLPTEAHEVYTAARPSVKHNLPAQLTPFIGRGLELAKLHHLLKTSRLLTLTGPPGTGKTRLSLQLAAEMLSLFEHGIFFISLAPVRDPALVVNAIAQAVEVSEAGKMSLLDALKQFVVSKQILLVLDNFEHVLPAAPVLSELLGAAPGLSVIVTSREVLHLYGEYEFSVPPLQLPDLKQPTGPDVIHQCEAVKLFVQQALAVRSDFALNAENAAAVAAICVHLDGLPLAIELAAARTRLYAPQTLLVRLSSRLQALTDGPRDFPARQKTLRDTLAWSYDLLDAEEKILFSRLGVFAGGCTLAAAQDICGENLELDVATGVESLLNKSLLRREQGIEDEPRFVMLETMREYALEKLGERGEMASIRERHARYFLAMAEEAAAEYHGANEVLWLIRLEAQHDNLRAVLRWSLEADETGDTSFHLIGSLARFWEMKGHFSEGRAWLVETLALSGAGARTKARADAFYGVGEIAYLQCDYRSTQALFEEALDVYRELGDDRSMADTLIGLGEVASETGDYEAAPVLFQQGYTIMKALDDPTGSARGVTQLGFGALRVGDYDQARQWLEEGLARYQASNDRVGTALSLSGLGEIALRKNELDQATILLEESLLIRREIAQKWSIAASLGSLAWVTMLQKDYDRAATILSESLDLRIEINDPGGIAWCLEKLAEMAHLRGEDARAVTIYGAAASIRERVASVIDPADQPHYQQIINEIRTALGAADFQRIWAEGNIMTVEQVTEFALGKL